MLIEKEALAESFHSKQPPKVARKNAEEHIHFVIIFNHKINNS